jgi:quercetin dioxygenase-like cupin family protein
MSVLPSKLIESLAADYSPVSGRTFGPAAPSGWHTHRAGQMLIVTAGRVEEWGGEKREINDGDVVPMPPGVKLSDMVSPPPME